MAIGDVPFWFPVRKFDDPVGLWKNFRHIEDWLSDIGRGDRFAGTLVIAQAGTDEEGQADFVCDGTADDVQIQEALDALDTNITDGAIIFHPGRYNITSNLTFDNGNRQLHLVGNGATLDIEDDVAVTLSVDHGSISGFIITGTGGHTYEEFIHLKSGHFTVFNNEFTTITGNSALVVGDLATTAYVIVVGNYFHDITLTEHFDAAVVKLAAPGGDAYACVMSNTFEDITGPSSPYGSYILVDRSQGHGLLMGNIVEQITLNALTNGNIGESHNWVNNVMQPGDHDLDLNDLTDVEAGSPSVGDLVVYDGDSWNNETQASQGLLHDDVASEFSALTSKGTPHDNDIVIIEDSEDSNNKKKITLSTISGGNHDILSDTHGDTDSSDTPKHQDVLTFWEPPGTTPEVRAVGAEGSTTPALPAGTVAGDLLICLVATRPSSQVTADGWTNQLSNNGGHGRLDILYRIATGSGDAPTLENYTQHIVSGIIGIKKDTFDTTDIFGNSAIQDYSSSTTIKFPTITTDNDSTLVLAATATNNDGSASSPTNTNLTDVTEQIDYATTSGDDSGLIGITGVKATAGVVGQTTCTYSPGVYHYSAQIAILPSGISAGQWLATPRPVPLSGFYRVNLAASLTADQLERAGTAQAIPMSMPYSGSIVGLSIASNEARTAGDATAEVYVNGSATGFTVVLDATDTTYATNTQVGLLDTFDVDDEIDVRITTDGSWAPTTADIEVTVWVT